MDLLLTLRKQNTTKISETTILAYASLQFGLIYATVVGTHATLMYIEAVGLSIGNHHPALLNVWH